MRGFKSCIFPININTPYVAPYTGAWIEISVSVVNSFVKPVAPYTGAWIEMSAMPDTVDLTLSHPTRVRGLK